MVEAGAGAGASVASDASAARYPNAVIHTLNELKQMYMKTSARLRRTHSGRPNSEPSVEPGAPNSASNAPISQSDCVTESGIATTLGSAIATTNGRRKEGDGFATKRSSRPIAANSNIDKKPMSASTQPSRTKRSAVMPRPSATIDSSGTKT